MTLDALRGVAATVVMMHHMAFWTNREWFGHAVLAVDFFFVLSGFVIANAYEDRLGRSLTFTGFTWLRIARLYPLIVFGAILAVISVVVAERPDGLTLPMAYVPIYGVTAALAVPVPPAFSTDTFPILPPEWSLFFEIVMNLVFAAGLFRVGHKALAAILCVLFVIYVGVARGRGINVGFRWEGFGFGFLRVALPFLLGVAIRRLDLQRRRFRLPGISALLTIVLLISLWIPAWPRADWLYWVLAVTIVYPAIIVAAITVTGGERISPIADFSARISYPLYIIHYPLLVLMMPAAIALLGPAPAMTILAALIAALALPTGAIDERFRKALRRPALVASAT